MFWFLLLALVVVVATVTLVVLGSSDGRTWWQGVRGGLDDAPPDRLVEPLPEQRPVRHEDVELLRLPIGLRGYEMREVDDVLDRLGAELAERDARIAELESALAGARAARMTGEASAGPSDETPGATC